MTILSRLDELKAIADAATPGPWLQGTYNGEVMPWVCDDTGVEIARTSLIRAVDDDHIGNAKFISNTRTAMPQLISALRVAVAELRDFSEFNPKGPHDYFQSASEKALKRIAKILEAGK